MPKPALLSTGLMMPLVGEGLEAVFDVHWLDRAPDAEAVIDKVGPDIVAACTGAHTGVKMTDAMLAKLPKLRVIGNFGVGYDSIDIAAAAKRGIVITNTPDVLTEEVADTAVGLLIATVREFGAAERYLRAGRWAKEGDYPLSAASLRDRSIGLIGMGRIGQAIARRLAAFGMPISYFARNPRAELPYRHYAKLAAMARDVDILLAIAPGGPSTERVVNAEVLAALGPKGIFINMARGTLVDEPALIDALRRRVILSAGLDVYMNEPRIDPAFLALDNVTLLPHLGSASQATRDKMGQLVVDNLLAFAAGKPPLTPVPETPFREW